MLSQVADDSFSFSSVAGSSPVKVGLLLISKSDLGGSCCGAAVGSSGKICIRSQCNVKSHHGRVAPVFSSLSEHGQLLMVSSGSPDFVYSQPSVDPSNLPADVLERALVERRERSAWAAWMSIAQTSELGSTLPSELDSPGLDKRAAAVQAQPLKTPARRPAKKAKTLAGSPFEVVLKPLGNDEATLDTFKDNFASLASELGSLKAQIGDQEDPSALLELICDKVNFLQAQVGQMPSNAPPTLWSYAAKAHQLLGDVIEEHAEFKGEMDSAIQDLKDEVAANRSEVDNQVDLALSTHLDGELGNFIQEAYLYASRTGPSVDRRLRNLEAAKPRPSGLSTEPALSPPDERITKLTAEMNELKASLRTLHARSGESTFEIAGMPFQSLEDTSTWVALERVSAFPFYFLDPVSLLQLMETGAKDANAMVKAAYEGERVNLNGDLEVGVAYSYLVEVPTILGGSLETVRKHPKALDRVKEFTDFETEGSYDMGLRKRVESDLKGQQSSIKAIIDVSGMSGAAQRVAINMLDESVSFIKKMFCWMSDQHRGYGIGSGISDVSEVAVGMPSRPNHLSGHAPCSPAGTAREG